MELQGQVAIVTGAGGGLGKSHALFLASRGARVVVNDMNAEAAQVVAAEIQAKGGQAMSVAASVTDEAQVALMVEQSLARWQRVDILINNAGILRDKSFAKMEMSDFRLIVEVHLMGAAICSKSVWNIMREQGYGRIVMTTSSSGLYGNFGQTNYGAAKMALVGLMQTLAIEGEKNNIRVNCLAPTAATQMTDSVLAAEALVNLSPDAVSPGLLALVSRSGPTRSILCAGAGHFASAHVTLTGGVFIGKHDASGEQVVAQWDAIAARQGEIVPDYGFTQAERELASAGFNQPAVSVAR